MGVERTEQEPTWKVNVEEDNYPVTPAWNRTRDLSITSPTLYILDFPLPLQRYRAPVVLGSFLVCSDVCMYMFCFR